MLDILLEAAAKIISIGCAALVSCAACLARCGGHLAACIARSWTHLAMVSARVISALKAVLVRVATEFKSCWLDIITGYAAFVFCSNLASCWERLRSTTITRTTMCCTRTQTLIVAWHVACSSAVDSVVTTSTTCLTVYVIEPATRCKGTIASQLSIILTPCYVRFIQPCVNAWREWDADGLRIYNALSTNPSDEQAAKGRLQTRNK